MSGRNARLLRIIARKAPGARSPKRVLSRWWNSLTSADKAASRRAAIGR